MILYNDRIITNSVGKWAQRPLHMVTTHGNHGSVNANPNAGEFGTNVTLSNTPDTGYRFTSYSIAGDGASLSGNTLTIGYSDVSVTGNFEEIPLESNSIRAKFKSGYTPTMGDTQTLVDSSNNIWDIHRNSNDFTNLFFQCNDILEVIAGNTSNVTSMYQMFDYCRSLTKVALFDTSSVTDMSYMFMRCDSLTSLPLFDTSNVTNMHGMCSASNITTAPAFNTSKVTNMSYLFSDCNITSVPLYDTSKVTNMSQMFSNCIYLETLPLFDTSNVTYMTQMCTHCMSLKAVPLFNTSKVTQVSYAFEDCFKVESGALDLYNQMANQTNPPTSHSYCFNDCGRDTTTGAAELAQIPSDWK